MELLLLGMLILILILYLAHRRKRCCNCNKCNCTRDNFELDKTECRRYPLQGLKPDYGVKEIDENEPCARFVRAP